MRISAYKLPIPPVKPRPTSPLIRPSRPRAGLRAAAYRVSSIGKRDVTRSRSKSYIELVSEFSEDSVDNAD